MYSLTQCSDKLKLALASNLPCVLRDHLEERLGGVVECVLTFFDRCSAIVLPSSLTCVQTYLLATSDIRIRTKSELYCDLV